MFFKILFTLFVSVRYTAGECRGDCNEPILLYEALKCRPIYASFDDCCPKRFDCSHIEKRRGHYCHFKGKPYTVGENINDNDIYGNCLIDCTCLEKRSGGKGFGCSILDCAEWVGLTPKKNCYFGYDLNKCCSTGEICAPFQVNCEINGVIYHEGQYFNPPHTKCTECICKKGFSGKFEAPFCKKMECMEEITNSMAVRNFCAPSYVSLDDCCPRQWICPAADDDVQRTQIRSNGPKCKFGQKTLNIGDKFTRIHSNSGGIISCECRIPPYLTCIQDEKYPVYPGDYH